MKRLVLLLPILLLAACSRPAEREAPSGAATEAMVAPAAPPSMEAGRAAGGAVAADAEAAPATAPAPGATPAPNVPAVTTPMLAYTFTYELEASAAKAKALMQSQIKACNEAGPTVCQVVAANQSSSEAEQFSGQVEMRAQPAWVSRFRDRIDADTEAAGGKVASANVASEDLTRAIVDTEAGLRARTLLRGRLEELLTHRNGELSDLLEVERELARVQGEIDATQSELAVMRTRVATSKIVITYRSTGVLATAGDVSPLGQAVNSFVGIILGGVAAMIYIVAFLLPWALLIALLLWLFRGPIGRWRERGRAEKARREAARNPPPAAPPPA